MGRHDAPEPRANDEDDDKQTDTVLDPDDYK